MAASWTVLLVTFSLCLGLETARAEERTVDGCDGYLCSIPDPANQLLAPFSDEQTALLFSQCHALCLKEVSFTECHGLDKSQYFWNTCSNIISALSNSEMWH